MPEWDNNLTGALFPNDKRGNDKAPSVTGPFEISAEQINLWAQLGTDIELRLAGWTQQSKGGLKYIQIKASEQQGDRQPVAAGAKSDDDIPF